MSEAFYLLLVGMISTTVVLSLVVGMGRLLIRVVNRMAENTAASTSTNIAAASSKQTSLSPAKLAAIVATVEIMTEGKGRVRHISGNL